MRRHCFLFLALSLLCACSGVGGKTYLKSVGKVFGTYYAVTYSSETDLTKGMEKAMDGVGKSLSTFDSQSVISQVNANCEVVLDKHFTTVFAKAMEVSEATSGAFDITVAPLVNLWGFGFDPHSERTAQQVDSVKQFVGWQKVKIEDGRVIKQDPRLMLDASAIAKGYACDVVAAYLDSVGVENYLVDIGGEIVAKGVNPAGNKWRIGINTPTDTAEVTDVQSIIEVSSKAVATSGNYRQFYESNGKKVGHTMDPRTGMPSINSVLSATVIAPNCMTADAYATAFMVLGDTLAIRQAAAAAPDSIEWYVIMMEEGGYLKEVCSAGFFK